MFYKLFFFFMISFQNKKCQPQGIYVTLGDYFSYNTDNYYNISFMMHRGCKKKLYLKYYQNQGDSYILQDPIIRKYDVKGLFYKENLDYHRNFYFFQLNNLETPYRFQYQIQDEDEHILAGPFEFNFNFDKNELKIVTFGDHDFEQGKLVYDKLLKEDYDLLILLGDYSYNIQDNNGKHGDDYIDQWKDLFTIKPVILFCGNHEDIDKFEMFNNRLKNPGTNQPNDNNYFHFKLKNTLLFSINFDIYLNSKNKQNIIQNLQKQIDLHKHDKIKHKFLLTHRPIYGQSQESNDLEFYLSPLILSEIEEFLIKNKFDFIISAHTHFYQRTKKIQKYQFKGRLRQIVIGTGSNKHFFQTVNLPPLEQAQVTLQSVRGYEIIHLQKKNYKFEFKEIQLSKNIIHDQFQSQNYGKAEKNIYLLVFVLIIIFVLIFILKQFQIKNKLNRKKIVKEVQLSIKKAFQPNKTY